MAFGVLLTRLSFVVRPIINISSETIGQIKHLFHMKTLEDWGTKGLPNGPGHITKLTATPIFSITRRPITLKLDMYIEGCEVYQICSKDDPSLTLTCLKSRSNLLSNAFNEKHLKRRFF